MAHVNPNDFSVMLNPKSKNAENVGKWLAAHINERRDPASEAPGMPPLYGQDAVPHTMTFQSLVGSFSRAYMNPDEAVRDSLNNAHLMEKDVGLLESVECRQRLTALLEWEIIPENEKCPYQVSLAQELQRIVSRIKHFTKYRMWLMKAIWSGRSGIQHKYGYTSVNGAMRLMPTPLHRDHNGWMPVNGDKIVFRYEDSLHNKENDGAYPHQMGIRVGMNMGSERVRIHRDYELEPVSDGMALFLKPYERDTFCVHKHFIEDADFQHSYFSGSIHGIGIRSKIYWEWFLKQEAFAFLMQYLERSAGGIEVWTYPMGDAKALAATQQAAREKMANGRNVIFFPKPLGDDSDSYKFEIIEPGAMGLDIMQSIIENYFGGRLKRYILGQELSTEAKATGMGSGVAEAHMDTLSQIVQFDASNLEETITHELVRYIQQLNFPETLGWHMRFSLKTQDNNTMERMEALNAAYQMGAGIAESDVFKTLGLSAPTGGDKILSLASQQQSQMAMQQAMQPQIPGMGMDDGSGGPPTDDPSGGPEDDSPEGDDSEDGGFDDETVGMIQSMMDQYVRDRSDVDYYGQGMFNWDESQHSRESSNVGTKHAGEFAPKNTGIFGKPANKQRQLFAGSPDPVKKRKQSNPIEQLKKIFDHHLNKQQQRQMTFDDIEHKPAAQEQPAPAPSEPAPQAHLEKETTDTNSHEELLKESHPYREYGPNYNRHIATTADHLDTAIKRGHNKQMLDMLGNELRLRLDVHGKKTTPEPMEAPELEPPTKPTPAPQQEARPRRRMAGHGADATPVAIPAPPPVTPKPEPKPEPPVSKLAPPVKSYRQVVKKEEKLDNGKSIYDQQESGIGSKSEGNAWPKERRDKFVTDHMKHVGSVVRFMASKGHSKGDPDSAESAAYEGLMNAARTYNENNDKGYSEEKFAKHGMAQAIRNLNRKKMDREALEATGSSGDDDYDAMAQIQDHRAQTDKAEQNDELEHVTKALSTLPENEAWLFRKWAESAIHPVTGKRDAQGLANEYNQTWGHLHDREVTRSAIDGTGGKIDQIRKKLKDSLPKQQYAAVREYVIRYYRKALIDIQTERYERRQDRDIREAAEYTETDPTDAQIKAGNYRKGRFRWNGMTIVIENPRGSVRRGVSDDGTIWKNTMGGHYGYISRTNGVDGDQIDIVMGRYPQSELVFVVHQVHKDGTFDEHKCILGCTNLKQAKELYLSNYPSGWRVGEVVPMTIPEFKEWIC